MGPANALKLIQEQGTIEKVLEKVATMKRFSLPEPFPFTEAR